MARIISRSAPRRGAAAIGAACLLVAACGRPAPSPEPSPRPSPTSRPATAAVRVVVLGDSLAAGLGLAGDEAFPAVVERLLRERGHAVEVVNAGVSGDTSAGGLARLEWVLQRPADILVVELGGNDALRGQELEATAANLREIVRRGRASGARVLLLGMDVPANYGPDYGGRFAALFERVAAEDGVALVPEFVRGLAAEPGLLQADGLHPTAAGQRLLAGKLLPALEALVLEAQAAAAAG